MRITGSVKQDNCLASGFVYKYFFDEEWTRDAIQSMAALGDLRYYADFPRPMFQVNCSDGTVVKGVQNTNECRVIFSRDGPDAAVKRFENSIDEINCKGG